jgi:hypothetical protein
MLDWTQTGQDSTAANEIVDGNVTMTVLPSTPSSADVAVSPTLTPVLAPVAPVGYSLAFTPVTAVAAVVLNVGDVAGTVSVLVATVRVLVDDTVVGLTTPGTKTWSFVLAGTAVLRDSEIAVPPAGNDVLPTESPLTTSVTVPWLEDVLKEVPVGKVRVICWGPAGSAPVDEVVKTTVYPVVAPTAVDGAAETEAIVTDAAFDTRAAAAAGSAAPQAPAATTSAPKNEYAHGRAQRVR